MKIVTEKKDWNQFVQNYGPRSGLFLQSWEWGNLQVDLGRSVTRYSADGAQAQVIGRSLPLGKTYSYIARGPIASSSASANDLAKLLALELYGDIFLSIDPMHTVSIENSKFQIVPRKDIQPSTTLITSLMHDDQILLEAMHGKTRYNIRLAEKRGVQIHIGVKDAIGAFVDLTVDTYRRHGIHAHDRKHYEMILKHLDGTDAGPRAFLATATHDGDVLAVAMCIDWNGTRTYLHGASSDTKKNLMAPYLLHWRLMQSAKSNGAHAYDWWGIAPEDNPAHGLQGVTRFKKGFGGEIVSMPSTVDVVLRPLLYKAYKVAKKFL